MSSRQQAIIWTKDGIVYWWLYASLGHGDFRQILNETAVGPAFNSLAPGRPGCHFKTAIFNLVSLINFFRSSNDNAPRWMPWDLTDGKSTLVQVMAWCRQATSHYLSQCWLSSMSPYGVTRPQWVNYQYPKFGFPTNKNTCYCHMKCKTFWLLLSTKWTNNYKVIKQTIVVQLATVFHW